MDRTLVAGVDSSTQSCKVVVRDAETGALVRSGRAPHPEGTEVDPVAWEQALRWGFTLTPGLRYNSQTAADFYKNPPFPRGYVSGQDYTADTRLASWGAITAGVIVGKTLSDGWNVTFRADYYRQDPDWQIFGTGSPGIQVFSARWLQVNLTKEF